MSAHPRHGVRGDLATGDPLMTPHETPGASVHLELPHDLWPAIRATLRESPRAAVRRWAVALFGKVTP